MSGDNGEAGKVIRETQQKVIEKISHYAIDLYEYMRPGEVVDITFQDPREIVVPGHPPKVKRLMLIKPYSHLGISIKKREEA